MRACLALLESFRNQGEEGLVDVFARLRGRLEVGAAAVASTDLFSISVGHPAVGDIVEFGAHQYDIVLRLDGTLLFEDVDVLRD